jgi:hypothetical protein
MIFHNKVALVSAELIGLLAVPSADPGFTATDLNPYRGEQTIEEGAVEPVRLALLGDADASSMRFP